jgi:hypothetical protein
VTLPPSNFRRDPLGHVGNQSAHFLLVGYFPSEILGPWGGATAALIGLVYFVGWEWGVQRLWLFWDSVEDAAFVTAGALFPLAVAMGLDLGAAITVYLWLGFGAWLRR